MEIDKKTLMTGSCVCKKVKFAVLSEITTLYQCHCSLCQKQTGTAAVTACFVDTEHFKWLSGEQEITSYAKESGYRSDFCRYCGAAVPNVFRSGVKVWVPAGALDNSLSAEITHHIFVSSKAPWDNIGGDANQHMEFYPVFGD